MHLYELYDLVIKIYYDENLDWEQKYDLIFSERISQEVFRLIDLDYCDPDTSYEEDVKAFVYAFENVMENLIVTKY